VPPPETMTRRDRCRGRDSDAGLALLEGRGEDSRRSAGSDAAPPRTAVRSRRFLQGRGRASPTRGGPRVSDRAGRRRDGDT